ncbi:tail fiber protein [Hymenobacter coalescens]
MDNYVGEIRIFAGNFAPVGWLFCQGQLLSIAEYEALYTLLGTTYGGDGQSTFALPNMASRVAVGQGQAPGLSPYTIGQMMGTETVTLSALQLAAHQHPISGTVNVLTGAPTGQTSPDNAYFGDKGAAAYNSAPGTATLAPGAVTGQTSLAGGAQPHKNIQPVTAINYIIATEGVYPQRD